MLRRRLRSRMRRSQSRTCPTGRYRPTRLLLQVPAFGVTYRGTGRSIAILAMLTVAALLTGAVAGRALAGLAGAALLVAVWTGRSLRLLRLVPLGPDGPGGPTGGGPAGVREPRRPRPHPPAGSLALAVPVDPPDEAVALA